MSIDIQSYYSIPTTVTVPIETYKTMIQESVSKDGVKWDFNKHQDVPTGYLNGRQRQPTYVFREYYVCRCLGSKREHADVIRDDTSVQVCGWQKRSKIKCPTTLKVVHQWLLQARSLCLDATHSTTNGILYTIVTRHSLTGAGCHVTSFFFLIDQSIGTLANFLGFLRNTVGILNIEKIIIDVSSTELGTIQEVYFLASAQWCLFHQSYLFESWKDGS